MTRGAGSHGCADLWAAQAEQVTLWDTGGGEEYEITELRLIQVKTDKRGPFCHFGPKDREALIALADKTGGKPELWWWPANKPCQVIFENEWPRTAAA